MDLGNFSVSLAVSDLAASRAFHETLGFTAFAGEASQHWPIMKNGPCVIVVDPDGNPILVDQHV